MKRIYRRATFALFCTLVLLAPTLLLAQSPFDGTLPTNMDQAKLSPKPYVFSLDKGMYDCSSCSPKIHVKADGQDQPVTGQSYDAINVREVDPKSITITTKKPGRQRTSRLGPYRTTAIL